ncbi:MAG: TFIIB-type zinc ribbon-containing protein, partial [Candidatus Bathyarchaeia archaeon]
MTLYEDFWSILGQNGRKEKLTVAEERRRSIRGVDHCPECGSSHIIQDYDSGEVICGGCGLVIHERVMDAGPEWRAFTREEKEERSRVGTPISYSIHDKGLSTVIDRVNRDAFGRELPTATRLQMLRLRK